MGVLVASRLAYNSCLEEVIAHYRETGKHLNRYAQDKSHGKQQHPDLPAVVVDTTLDRLQCAFACFFRGIKEGRRVGFPRFKPARRWDSIQFRDAQHDLRGCYFSAPRMCGGKIRVNVHRPLAGTFKFARIVLRPSGWYLQCICDVETNLLLASEAVVGIDMGITYLVADSTGRQVKNPKNLQHAATKLAKAQRRLSKCVKGSRRRNKARKVVARHHERIANRRKDGLHKLSREYVNAYGTIVVEDLQPANMMRNRRFAKAIGDASWGMLRRMLEAKAEEAGRRVVAVPPHYTSQRCSACGVNVQKSLSVRTHICPNCGYVADRDVNAALNILKAGLERLASARTGPSLSLGEGLVRNDW